MKGLCLGHQPLPKIENLVWEKQTPDSDSVREATFDTPFSEFVPDECKKAHFQIIVPSDQPVRAVVVHFQMTADESFEFRRKHIASKLLSSGIASILLMNPLYGTRRPLGQERHFYRTVSDFVQATVVGIIEGAMVVNWCRSEFPEAAICLTGISAGAVSAAGSALLSGGQVAVVPCIGPGSGRPFVNGALSSHVNWSSITRSLGCANDQDAQAYLLELFSKKHLRKMSNWRKESGQEASLVSISVAASNDRCVPPIDSQELHEILREASHYEEINWIYGGHCLGIKLASARFVPVVERAIRILQQSIENTVSDISYYKTL